LVFELGIWLHDASTSPATNVYDSGTTAITSEGATTSSAQSFIATPSGVTLAFQGAYDLSQGFFLPQPEIPEPSWQQMRREQATVCNAQAYMDPTQAWFLTDPFKPLANPVEFDHQPVEYPYESFRMMSRPTRPDMFHADPTAQAILPVLPLTPGWTQVPPEKPTSRAFVPVRPDATTVWPIYPDWSGPTQAESFWRGTYERAPRQTYLRSGPEIHVTFPYPGDAAQNVPPLDVPSYPMPVFASQRQSNRRYSMDSFVAVAATTVLFETNHAYDVQQPGPSRRAWFRPIIAGGMDRTPTVLVEVLEDVLQVWNVQQTQPIRPLRLNPQPSHQHELSITAPAQLPPMMAFDVAAQSPVRQRRPVLMTDVVERIVPFEETISTVQTWNTPAVGPLPRLPYRTPGPETVSTLQFTIDLTEFHWDQPSPTVPARRVVALGTPLAQPILPPDQDFNLFVVWQGQAQAPGTQRREVQQTWSAALEAYAPAQVPPMLPFDVASQYPVRQRRPIAPGDFEIKLTPFVEDVSTLQAWESQALGLPVRMQIAKSFTQQDTAGMAVWTLDPTQARVWEGQTLVPLFPPPRRADTGTIGPVLLVGDVAIVHAWAIDPQPGPRQRQISRQGGSEPVLAWTTDAAPYGAWQGQEQVPSGLWSTIRICAAAITDGNVSPSWQGANVIIVAGPYFAVAGQIFVAGAMQGQAVNL